MRFVCVHCTPPPFLWRTNVDQLSGDHYHFNAMNRSLIKINYLFISHVSHTCVFTVWFGGSLSLHSKEKGSLGNTSFSKTLKIIIFVDFALIGGKWVYIECDMNDTREKKRKARRVIIIAHRATLHQTHLNGKRQMRTKTADETRFFLSFFVGMCQMRCFF